MAFEWAEALELELCSVRKEKHELMKYKSADALLLACGQAFEKEYQNIFPKFDGVFEMLINNRINFF